MIKILFLDIDGVLNSIPHTHDDFLKLEHEFGKEQALRKSYGFNIDLVAKLKTIIEKTNCKIVFSTSWRHFKDHHIEGDNWRKTLAELLEVGPGIFIGDTPILSIVSDEEFKRLRGTEIKNWIDASDKEPFNYCVLDDEICDIITVIPHENVVQTNSNTGLSNLEVEKCIDILNHETTSI